MSSIAMVKLLCLIGLASVSACLAQVRPHAIEPADPRVGELGCATMMSIHDLVASLDRPPVDPDACQLREP